MKKIFLFTTGLISIGALLGFISIRHSYLFNPLRPSNGQYDAENAFPNLSFSDPVEFIAANDGSTQVFVVEQAGIIKVFENSSKTAKASTFLDIRKRVSSGGEMGLLGLTFHPKFKENGYFFVNYTRDEPRRQTVISRFKANQNQVEPNSEVVLLTFDQPYSNHNGGDLDFGADGFLYISTGDGGSGGDPQNNSQNRANLLGKILRIDVNSQTKGNYGIPADNPFIANNQGFREEIYAFGLRNPWRFSFDSETKTLWAGDVGQNAVEEIDIIENGKNYGWRIKEGNNCYGKQSECTASEKNLTPPIWTYQQGSDGRSVTGGIVYRGKKHPELYGKYIYADYVSGKIWALDYQNGKVKSNELLINLLGSISAFGEDKDHEMYICNYSGEKIMKLKSSK